MTALRFMTQPPAMLPPFATSNTLAEYVRAGGQLWIAGGGIGTASLRNFAHNDLGGIVFANGEELVAGGLLYDQARWRQEGRAGTPSITTLERGGDQVRGDLTAGDWARLPKRLDLRSPATDPLPPLRTSLSFYDPRPSLEWISKPTHVVSDPIDSTGWVRRAQLDTLMTASLGSIDPGSRPVMTVASGPNGGRVVYSGFDLWSWRRSQCAELVDGVLGGIWGLTRQPVTSRRIDAAASEPRAIMPARRSWTAGHSVSSTEK